MKRKNKREKRKTEGGGKEAGEREEGSKRVNKEVIEGVFTNLYQHKEF